LNLIAHFKAHEVQAYDAQPIAGSDVGNLSILVTIHGHVKYGISGASGQAKAFTQTMILVPGDGDSGTGTSVEGLRHGIAQDCFRLL
jgi:hypothetical protein